ncbi:5'-nucleotidase domain-containing protein [Apiospora saccharicola]|uniref:5'-nucleotidase domain-containing protein n=1 Tax=Apiospora saccharicola TaxID=335842 RepID=A0ABR1TGJ3_9PEZI
MARVTSAICKLAAAAATLARAGLASAAEDALYSRHLSKRFVDDAGNFNVSFYHINDVHAHLDEFGAAGTDCTKPERGCFGGYARVKTVMEQTRPDHPDSLLLNVGDEFQGTLFYTFYKGEKIAQTLNQMGFDAMTLGNHEFDGGDDELADFIQNLTFPVVSANLVSDHPGLNASIKPFHVFDEYELAVIGLTTDTVPDISKPGKGTKFGDHVESMQATIDHIHATLPDSVKRIAAITHIGYDEDIKLAKATRGLHLIMGGHSHTLLGGMDGAAGKYPTVETNQDGDEVFIVTAYRWGEYLGYIDVTYDAEGKVLAYHGAPVHLTNATKQDEGLQKQVDEWRKPFDAFGAEVVGTTNVELDQTKCQKEECYLGDFVCDAMLQYRQDGGSDAALAFTNAGGIRATIDAGPITRGEVLTSFPFGNAVVELTYTGAELWRVFEGAVSKVNQFNGKTLGGFFQVSRGVKVEYNPENEAGKRLVRLTVDGKLVDREDGKTAYRVVTIDFVATGGDNILEPVEGIVILDTMDEVLVDYIKAKSPVGFTLEGRIAVVDGQATATGGGNGTTPSAGSPAGPTPRSEAIHISGVGSSLALLIFTAVLYYVVS